MHLSVRAVIVYFSILSPSTLANKPGWNYNADVWRYGTSDCGQGVPARGKKIDLKPQRIEQGRLCVQGIKA